MGILDRYKKSGGFAQLLTLIETSTPAKRENFLKLIKEENPAWEEALCSRILTVERIFSWPVEALMEITSRVQPICLAGLSLTLSSEHQEKLNASMSATIRRQTEEARANKQFNKNEMASCLEKFFVETRTMIGNNTLRVDKFDAEMSIPEDFEEKLNSKPKPSMAEEFLAPAKNSVLNSSAASSVGPAVVEEINDLRRKLQYLAQENVTLKQENIILKDKLDKIKRIA